MNLLPAFAAACAMSLFCLLPSSAAHARFASESNSRNRLLEETRNTAARLEQNGQLREAVDQWWIVDALSPANSNARANISRLEDHIEKLTQEAMARGSKAKEQGKTGQAQQAFLMVLQLSPGHPAALAALREIETDIVLKELKKYGAEGPAAPERPTM